jgi:membrane-bound serine protease (ClpP class)
MQGDGADGMTLKLETAIRIVVFNALYILGAVIVIFYFGLPPWLLIPILVVIILWGMYVYKMNIKMLGMPPRYTGIEGEEGTAMTPILNRGKVKVKGEIWNAWSSHPIEKGKRVRVVGREGITVEVAPLENMED